MATNKEKTKILQPLLAQFPLDPPRGHDYGIDISGFKAIAVTHDVKSISKLSLSFIIPASKVPPSAESGSSKFFGYFPVTEIKKGISDGKSYFLKNTKATIRLDIKNETKHGIMTIEFHLKGANVHEAPDNN